MFYNFVYDLNTLQLPNSTFGFLKVIKLKLPAAEAAAQAPLSPIIGQLNLSTSEVCLNFNLLSKHFEPGLMLTVFLFLLKDKKFLLVLKAVSFKVVCDNMRNTFYTTSTTILKPNKTQFFFAIDILSFYIICITKIYIDYKHFLNKKFFLTLLGSFKSMRGYIKHVEYENQQL